MAILEVLIAPDPILKKRADEVKEVDDALRNLMDNMLETMYHDDGVGLAANQVGVSKRVIVFDLQQDDDQKRPQGFYPLYVINPKIIEVSDEMIEAKEGCISVPGQYISVKRHTSIKVKYLDYNNHMQELNTGGWLARVIQHEIDHLDGITLIDYLSKLKKNVVIRKLEKLKRLG